MNWVGRCAACTAAPHLLCGCGDLQRELDGHAGDVAALQRFDSLIHSLLLPAHRVELQAYPDQLGVLSTLAHSTVLRELTVVGGGAIGLFVKELPFLERELLCAFLVEVQGLQRLEVARRDLPASLAAAIAALPQLTHAELDLQHTPEPGSWQHLRSLGAKLHSFKLTVPGEDGRLTEPPAEPHWPHVNVAAELRALGALSICLELRPVDDSAWTDLDTPGYPWLPLEELATVPRLHALCFGGNHANGAVPAACLWQLSQLTQLKLLSPDLISLDSPEHPDYCSHEQMASQLTGLRELLIDGCCCLQMQAMPAALCLVQLTSLHVMWQEVINPVALGIPMLPRELSLLSRLRDLRLAGEESPLLDRASMECLTPLATLTKLELSGWVIRHLPAGPYLKGLQSLDLFWSCFKGHAGPLPFTAGAATGLRALQLDLPSDAEQLEEGWEESEERLVLMRRLEVLSIAWSPHEIPESAGVDARERLAARLLHDLLARACLSCKLVAHSYDKEFDAFLK